MSGCASRLVYQKDPGESIATNLGQNQGYTTKLFGDELTATYNIQSGAFRGGADDRLLAIYTMYRLAEASKEMGKPYFLLTGLTDFEYIKKRYDPLLVAKGTTWAFGTHSLSATPFATEQEAIDYVKSRRPTHTFVYEAEEVMAHLKPHILFPNSKTVKN